MFEPSTNRRLSSHRSPTVLACLVIALWSVSACNVFEPRSGALACTVAAECDAPRVCELGYCVVPAAFLPDADLALPDADPNVPDADPNAPDANTSLSCIVPLVDDFADGVVSTSWLPVPGDGVTIAETNGVLRVSLPSAPAQNTKGGYQSAVTSLDFTGRAFFVEILQMVNVSVNASVIVTIGQNGNSKITATQKQGTVTIELRDGGMSDLATFPYDSSAHRWWQFIESAGSLDFQTSADGMNWTTRATTPTPAFMSSSSVSLLANANSGAVAPGVAEFDNVNGGGLFNPCQ